MGLLDRLRGRRSDDSEGGPGDAPAFIDDWPDALPRPSSGPHPDDDFAADAAPPRTIGVVQWTPGTLVDGGAGEGFWDYWDLAAWADGQPPSEDVLDGADAGTSLAEIEERVTTALGTPVVLTPETWTFSRDGRSWLTAPLLVVRPRD